MTHRTTQRDINAAERARLALQLRKQGHTLDEIAEQCGFQDKSGAHRAIKRGLESVPVTEALELRTLECLRLDEMLKALYPKALKGDGWSIDRVIAISKRRSEITGMDTRPDEIATQQNYVKRIVLTHAQPVAEGVHEQHTND